MAENTKSDNGETNRQEIEIASQAPREVFVQSFKDNTDPKVVNDFLRTVDVVSSGISITDGRVWILYLERKDRAVGLAKEQQLRLISKHIAIVQNSIIGEELELRYWSWYHAHLLIKVNAKKDDQLAELEKARQSKLQAEEQVNVLKNQLRLFQGLYQEIEKGEYVV